MPVESDGFFESGDAADAMAWVDGSGLSPDTVFELGSFVERYPTLRFYRETPPFFDRLEASASFGIHDPTLLRTGNERGWFKLPTWWRAVRSTLAFVHDGGLPPKSPEFQLGNFELSEPALVEYLPRLRYHIGVHGLLNDDVAAKLGPWGFLLIGFCSDKDRTFDAQSWLAVSTNPADERLFELSVDFVTMDHGEDVRQSIRPVFARYSRFLDNVIEIDFSNGTSVKEAW